MLITYTAVSHPGWVDYLTLRPIQLRVAKQCLLLERFQMLNGFHGGHRADVHRLQFLNHRVFLPLEQRQLKMLGPFFGGRDLGMPLLVQMVCFQLAENLFRSFIHFPRDSGESGDVNAVTLVGPALDNSVQEDHVVIPFLHRYVPVANAWQRTLQIDQFVVVGSEHGS